MTARALEVVRRARAVAIVVLGVLAGVASAATVNFSSSGSWTAPAGVTSVTVEAWGAGGAGGGATGNPAEGGGGAGGQYAKKTLTVVPGTRYAVVIGAGGGGAKGDGAAGGDSSFAATSVVAKGGAGGTAATNGVAGSGSTTGGVGDIVYAGGSGANGVAFWTSCYDGGAGGGGAGSGGAGGNASGNAGGTGTATGGGAGASALYEGNGVAGSSAGGGGGGACTQRKTDRSGGAGGNGMLRINYSSTVTTGAATALTASAARLNGTVNANGLAMTAIAFDYGLTTAYGWTATATPATVASNVVGNTAVYADLSGLACNTAYHFRVKATNGEGTIYGDDLSFTTSACSASCSPPSNIPSDVAVNCVCDNFGRTDLNPSTIFGGNWALSNSDGISDPYIKNAGFLRLTENTRGNAKAATAPGIFPAAGNYISVEFRHYAYAGTSTGADGIAVTLSDYSVPAVPGAFGGSLGYAQKSNPGSDCKTSGGCPGFAGGWLGVGIDEFGNYLTPNDGRIGGNAAQVTQSIGVRGPGAAQNGYRWLGGHSNVGEIDSSGSIVARGYMYQVVVDSRNSATGTVNVSVNRDTTAKNGSAYSSLFGPFNAYPEASYAVTQNWITKVVPDYWKISFTGSTGSYTNIHEIGSLRICAQAVFPSTGGIASGFSAIDEGYPGTLAAPPAYQTFQTGDIFMKLAATPFKLWVAALTTTPAPGVAKNYAASNAKYVRVNLVDNSDNVCGSDAARTCIPECTDKAAVEAGGSQIVKFPQGNLTGAVLSPEFTLNSAYQNLIAVMKECTDSTCVKSSATAAACSADSFSVRPLNFSSVTSTNATNQTTLGMPVIKADGDSFALTATTSAGYRGVPKINSGAVSAVSPATVAGTISGEFAAATAATSSTSTAVGAAFKYSEVGAFRLLAPDYTLATPRIPGVYDRTWSTIDSGVTDDPNSVPTKADCIPGSTAAAYSNSKNSDGKYGCNFGIAADTTGFGRFIPAEFRVSGVSLINRQAAACSPASTFSYLDEPMGLSLTLEARSGSGNITRNYSGDLAKLDLSTTAKAFSSSGLAFAAAVPSPFAALSARLSATGLSGTWPAFGASNAGTISLSGTLAVSSLNSPTDARAKRDGPFTDAAIGIAPQDSDGVRLPIYDLDADNSGGGDGMDHLTLATTTLYFGQLRLFPAIGSELLPLTMRAEVQRWNGTAFVPNGDDSCTRIPLASLGLGDWTLNLNAGETSITSGQLVIDQGAATLRLSAPGKSNNGSVVVTAGVNSAGLAFLAGHWRGALKFDQNPAATASFGLYKGSGKIIYFRENY